MKPASNTILFLCCLHLLAGTGAAAEEKHPGLLRLSAQYVHSSGSYGLESDTTIDSAAVNLDYFRGPWFFRVAVPYVRISGFGTVTMGAGGPLQISHTMDEAMHMATPGSGMPGRGDHEPGMPAGDGNGTGHNGRSEGGMAMRHADGATSRTSESGLGDITLEAGYGFHPLYPEQLLVETTALVKLPTADEDKGLGTGETDYGFQVELRQPMGSFTPFLSAGYTLIGDSDQVDYSNIWTGAIGTMYTLTRSVTSTLTYDVRSRATEAADHFQEISLEVDWRIHRNWTVSCLGAAGLRDAAPDWSAGVTVGMTF